MVWKSDEREKCLQVIEVNTGQQNPGLRFQIVASAEHARFGKVPVYSNLSREQEQHWRYS